MDQIVINGLDIFAYHGVNPEEKENGQHFVLNLTLHTDVHRPGQTDALADTVNYSSVVKLVTKTMQEGPYNLIERAATRVAEAVLAAFPTVEQVDVLLKKPQAPIKATFSYVAVAISRKRN